MLSSVEADAPLAYIDSGEGIGVVDTAPLFPTTITVANTWHRSTSQTIEFWFRQDADATNNYCVVSAGTSSTRRMIIAVMAGTHQYYPGHLYLGFTGSAGGGSIYTNDGWADGEWHHGVVIIDQSSRTNVYIYVDSVLVREQYYGNAFRFENNWGNTRIGDTGPTASGYSISGSPIDEIALYNKALSPERILAHYEEVMAGPAGPSVAIAGQIDISGLLKTNKLVRLDTAQFDISGALKVNKPVRLTTAQIDISGSLLIDKVLRLNTAQIDISGSLKTNKLVRLNTAQFDVDGFIGVLSQDPLLSTVAADQPREYVNSGLGVGVVGSAPLWPTNISVPSTWSQSSDQTIEFWFKQEPDSTSSYGVLSVGTNTSNYLFVAVMRSNHASYGGQVFLSFAGSAGANWRTENRYDDGQWHHCVIQMMNMYGVLNQYFYIDGELESSNFYYGEFSFGNWGDTVIGDVSRIVNGYSISGSPIDEIALYDYLLDDDRILAHYNEVMSTPSELEVSIGGTISVSGSLSTLVLRDPLFVRVSSVVHVLGSLGLDMYGKPVSISLRFPTSELDIIVQTGIGVRI